MKGEAIDVLDGSPPVSYSNNGERKIISHLEIFFRPRQSSSTGRLTR